MSNDYFNFASPLVEHQTARAGDINAIARAIESGDQELCSRMLDTSVAVSRVLETARRDAGIRFPSEF